MIESIFFHPWVWIIPIVLVILLAVVVVSAPFASNIDYPAATFGLIFGGLVALVLGGVYFGVMLPPYDASFYQTYRVTGELTEIEAAISSDGGSMSQEFIAKVDGVGLFIRSDDQRFRTLHVGDDVNLVCVKGFGYFQEPWLDCAIGGGRR